MFAKVTFVGLLVLGFLLPLRTQTAWEGVISSPTGEIAFLSPETFERYKWVGANTKPGDYIFERIIPTFISPFCFATPRECTTCGRTGLPGPHRSTT